MSFLAAQFGEDIHARLLRSSARTFEAALADVTNPTALASKMNHVSKSHTSSEASWARYRGENRSDVRLLAIAV
jgi:hypothetical protein